MPSKTYRPVRIRLIVFLLISALLLVLIMRLGNIFAGLLGMGLTVFTIYASFVSKGHLTLSENEISIDQFEQTKTLCWHEISEITDYKLWLNLSNQNQDIKILITCFLKNYMEIREFVAKKRPDLLSE